MKSKRLLFPDSLGAIPPSYPAANRVAKAMLARFGVLVIPIETKTISGKLPGQVTTKFGDAECGIRLEYVRPATQEEWEKHAAALLSMIPRVPEMPQGWEPWVLQEEPES